jgi:glycosyltransferase involved in cell wall biosynthesis
MPATSEPTDRNPAPRFAVVVPAFNAARTLAETLDSVAGQEFDDWECVVVDDGSTDETPAMVQAYCDRDDRFRLVRQANAGAAGAYRTAVGAARSDLLVICAADDLLLPAHLRTMDAVVRAHPDFEIYSSNGEYLYDDSGDRRPVYWAPEWQRERSLSFIEVIAECFYSVGVVFRRQVYEWTGGHRTGVYTDDYDLWLRAMAHGARHWYTPAVLSVHRVSSFQQSANLERLYDSNIEVYEHLLATEDLAPDVVSAVRAALAANRECRENLGVGEDLEQQARDLRRAVQRVIGPRYVDTAMRLIHSVSWITRPLRRWLAKRRHDGQAEHT